MRSFPGGFVSSTPVRLSAPANALVLPQIGPRMQADSTQEAQNRSLERQSRDMARYRHKVRRRLFASAVRLAEEDVDAIAAAAPEGTVASIGGAYLDEGAAGPRAGSAAPLPGADGAVRDIFARGITFFREGRYPEAEASFRAAEKGAGGTTGRLGGELALWRAQAVYAMGGPTGRKDAAEILGKLEVHADIEVRKAAAEMKFIYTAPPLPLDSESFLKIPEFDFVSAEDVKHSRYVLAANGIGRTARPKIYKPEKYSLQWYLEKERPIMRNESGNQDSFLLTLTAAGIVIFLATAFLQSQPPVSVF